MGQLSNESVLNRVSFELGKSSNWSVLNWVRLGSGQFCIGSVFNWVSELNLNLNSSDCRTSKIIWNDINLEAIPWVLNIENPL